MALPNQIVFGVLMLEIALFLILAFPLPFKVRRAMFKAIADSKIIAQGQYVLRISFVCIGILFVDAVRALLKIEEEGKRAKDSGMVRPDLRGETDFRSRRFLAQRNFYLNGFTLFLGVILSRTYSLILDLIKAQEEAKLLKAGTGAEIETPTAREEKLRSQLDTLQSEYDALSRNYASSSNKKVD